MKNRTMLRTQIDEAWLACIAEDYNRQRINSERSLQASFWSQLNHRLHAETRRMFIEPGMKSEGDGTRYPDIVICNTEKVIAIVELKYTPRAVPNWKKDLETFEWIHAHRDITISNSRFRGEAVDNHKYPLDTDLVFVWAGIHLPSEERLGTHIPEALALHFMELHHQTNVDVE